MSAAVRPTDPKLLELLVAPGSQNPLRYDAEAQELVDDIGQIAFPIRDGIPVMLVEEARVLGDGVSSLPDATPSA